MNLYQMTEDFKGWQVAHAYDYNVKRKWEVPGVDCNVCGDKWGNPVIAYPTVDCSAFPNVEKFEDKGRFRWVRLEEYLSLQAQVKTRIAAGLPVPPGTQLGKLTGTVTGQHGDFFWCCPPTVLIHPSALEELIKRGVQMPPTVKPDIKARGKKLFEHLEIQAEVHLKLSERCIRRKRPDCSACGSSGIVEFISPDLVEKSSIPRHLDLFRMYPRTNYFYVTERFAEAAMNLGLTNVKFQPVEVI